MNSISRNKYIDKSATPLKAYFTLASCCGRAQTTRARVCARPFSGGEARTQRRARDRARERLEHERAVYGHTARETGCGRTETKSVYTGCPRNNLPRGCVDVAARLSRDEGVSRLPRNCRILSGVSLEAVRGIYDRKERRKIACKGNSRV